MERENPDHVTSPCISVCELDANGRMCVGCFRTLDEIAAWGRMDDVTKREVWQAIGERLARKDPS